MPLKFVRYIFILLLLLAVSQISFIQKYLHNAKHILIFTNQVTKHKSHHVSSANLSTKSGNISSEPPLSFKLNSTKSIQPTQHISARCKLWEFPKTVVENITPTIALDSKKYIYPGVLYGPNNQIIGLKNAIYLAIRLNRTLAIPAFKAHYTHPGSLSPYQIIDVNRLCKFVSCISIQRLRKECNSSFDVAFQGDRGSSFLAILRVEKSTGMNILYPKKIFDVQFSKKMKIFDKNITAEIPTLPNRSALITYPGRLSSNSSFLKTAMNTSAPCAIFPTIYNAVDIELKSGIAFPLNKNEIYSINKLADHVLFSSITDAVQHPPCIAKAAQHFIRDVFKEQLYVAVHWRYNEKDWIGKACKKNSSLITKICNNLKNIKPTHVAKAIVNYVTIYGNKSNSTFEKIPVYIASPTSLKNFQDDVFTELARLNTTFNKPSETLRSFLSRNYQICWRMNGWSNVEEIISLVEMEIAILSFWFFYSPESTWSENVLPYRTTKTNENNLQKKFAVDIVQAAADEAKSNH